MKPIISIIVAFLFLELLAIPFTKIGFCKGSSHIGCIQSERQALLRFKQDLKDSSNRLTSWTGDGDCCTWDGIVCDNLTGHVVELHLTNPHKLTFDIYMSDAENDAEYAAYERSKLIGKINPSLLYLKQLAYLDLSCNNFEGIKIPKFLGSMRNLRYLNLSRTGFVGMIPQQLGNLSCLQYLDVSGSYYELDLLIVEKFNWLSGLSLLKYLDLSYVDLSKASDWFLVSNSLPSLVVLQLSDCSLQHLPLLPIVNFSSLATLDLSSNFFDNSLFPRWVFGLLHLKFLDLSGNFFGGPILDGHQNLTSLSRLEFLDLSLNNFDGPIPDRLQNLTSLRHLDLSNNNFNDSISNNWLYKFKYLEYLSLAWNNLRGAIFGGLGNLTSIKTLDLSFNVELERKIPRSWENLCSLTSISLSNIILIQEISEVLDIFSKCVLRNLEYLNFKYTRISGSLTNQLEKFQNLEFLCLSHNLISGHIPSSIGNISSLIHLDVSYNNLCGSIPSSVGQLSSLEYLDISNNKLNGSLFPIHFVNLTKLSLFSTSGNSLTMKVYLDWVPPFQLQYLYLRSCNLGTQFPSWLLSQNSLSHLELSNTGIVGSIPNKFWEYASQYTYLNLSYNQIYGMIPNLTKAVKLEVLDLSSNNMSGSLPLISSNLGALYLSNNTLSGSIFHFLCHRMNEVKNLIILNLEINFFSGELPDCWMSWKSLSILQLSNNNFRGSIPISLGSLSSMTSLDLYKNNFSGILPMSLSNLTELIVLDIGENEFVGNVPKWIGERFSSLIFLNLRSNKFHGPLPKEICHLASLQIFDVAHNKISGSVPTCINNISNMVTMENISITNNLAFNSPYGWFIEVALLVMKGKISEYNTNLNLVRSIDISNNKFSGEIPMEVTKLKALQSLNFSYNLFTGSIPKNIGAMRSLESIDFSENHLNGEIPQSMSSLTFLSYLNLSNNNLTGKIPLGTQLQSFDPSCFIGNDLCGSPLPNNCTTTVAKPDFENGGGTHGNEREVDWFYVSMALGFMVGFWSIISPLMINRRWRYKYYHFLSQLWDKFVCVVRQFC